jgi:hypothetical protein
MGVMLISNRPAMKEQAIARTAPRGAKPADIDYQTHFSRSRKPLTVLSILPP